MKFELFQINELARAACEMVENDMDYMKHSLLPDGYMLGLYADGVWVVDARNTCVMEQMPRVVCLNGPAD